MEEMEPRIAPDLNVDGVCTGADEGFDPEVLLQRVEEQLDLPALLVDAAIIAAERSIKRTTEGSNFALCTHTCDISTEGGHLKLVRCLRDSGIREYKVQSLTLSIAPGP